MTIKQKKYLLKQIRIKDAQIKRLQAEKEAALEAAIASPDFDLKSKDVARSAVEEVVFHRIDIDERIWDCQMERDRIVNAIYKIEPDGLRSVLIMRYVEGKSWDDIATIMDCTVRNAYYIHRAALDVFEAPGKDDF